VASFASETGCAPESDVFYHTKKARYPLDNRSQWPRGLKRGFVAACLLGLWVQIPPESWMSVSCECSVVTGRGLFVGLITRPEKSYRVWFV
jgi:hypothetical protein